MKKLLLLFLLGLCLPGWMLSQSARPDFSAYIKKHYQKSQHLILMRDGTQLHTTVYSPKKKGNYPIVMKRTCYSCQPYGKNAFPTALNGSFQMIESGYIFVCQDVRGRYMSEGSFDNMRPQLTQTSRGEGQEIDESTDTYDTIDWLIKNLSNTNGKVGMWGISYPGFYTAVGALCGHPALKASVPQAPIGDFYFDDFHHNGAYTLAYFPITSVFSYQKDGPKEKAWYPLKPAGTPDGYQYFMDLGPLKNGDKIYGEDAFFWQELKAHPDYDEFWQKRGLIQHLHGIDHAVMTVGGWYDAEDLFGPLTIYKSIEKNNPNAFNMLVMGPWSHGDWAWRQGRQTIGYVDFGDNADISEYYRTQVEFPFFEHFLKDKPLPKLPEALMYDGGAKSWGRFDAWPPKAAQSHRYYLHPQQQLKRDQAPTASHAYAEFVSDPAKPVPYTPDIRLNFTPRPYMSDDQRFAGRRPDVLVFETEVLTEAVTLAGEIMAHLKVSTTGTDADWVVKLIDVYPGDHPNYAHNPPQVKMGHYQQMVRSEIIRGRYRNSFSEPEPFVPGEITAVKLPLQDVYHTFKPGHRIMIQIQSTWFPLFDRNPQCYVDNIFEAEESDFIKATHRVYHSAEHPSYVEVQALEGRD